MSLLKPTGSLSQPSLAKQEPTAQTRPSANTNTNRGLDLGNIDQPKCFGTDYFGKWNTTGMTYEAMKVDRPDYQRKCANCELLERCYLVNHIRILRIKR